MGNSLIGTAVCNQPGLLYTGCRRRNIQFFPVFGEIFIQTVIQWHILLCSAVEGVEYAVFFPFFNGHMLHKIADIFDACPGREFADALVFACGEQGNATAPAVTD